MNPSHRSNESVIRRSGDGDRHRPLGHRPLVVALVLGMLLASGLAVWTGCTPERRYELLNFFFDGVPDPFAPKVAVAPTDDGDSIFGVAAGPAGKPVTVYLHKPYADNQCTSCHVGASGTYESFTKLESSTCLTCHPDVPRQYRVMHGPVAAVECNWCHAPHESTVKWLLKEEAPAVCVQCHDRELLSPRPPEHLMQDKSCLACHFGHGGPEHGLLREGIALQNTVTTRPTTSPTTKRRNP
jgi:predicted CXXCH cytochrome family protein